MKPMGLFDRLFFKNFTLKDLDDAMMNAFRGAPVHSGVTVNEETALRYVPVFACTRVLAETMGSIPAHVFRRRDGNHSELIRDHPNSWLIHNQPNDEMVSMTWRETKMGHIALSGNGYSILTHNKRGDVMDIYPWDWHKIQPVRNKDTGKLQYRIRDRGKDDFLPIDRVLHIPGLGFDGISGYSPISMAREAVGIGLAMTEFSARFFGSGMNVGGIIEVEGELSPTARKEYKEFFKSEGRGLANSWEPLILEFGQKYSRIPMLLKDAQFVEGWKLTDAQIAALFRVPLHMIQHHDGQPRANVEQMSLEFVMYTILPWAVRWEQAMNWKLFSRLEREQGFYVKLNIFALLRADAKSQAEALHIARQDGVINADEWRAMLEMNPQPDGMGQRYLVNGNMTPVDAAGVSQPKDRRHWTVNEQRKADGLDPVPDGDVPLDEWLRKRAAGGESN